MFWVVFVVVGDINDDVVFYYLVYGVCVYFGLGGIVELELVLVVFDFGIGECWVWMFFDE